MRSIRLLAAVLVCVVPLAGCDEDTSGTRTSSEYVDVVEALLDPPAQMAQLVAAQLRQPPEPWPSPAAVEKLIEDADGRLDDLRGVALGDAGLRAQRGRLVDRYAVALGRMRNVGGDLTRRDRAGLRSDAPDFFDALGALSSRP